MTRKKTLSQLSKSLYGNSTMERMIVGIIASALLGLGAWNLNQTFNLSIEIENVKGKIDVLEKSIKQVSKKKKKHN